MENNYSTEYTQFKKENNLVGSESAYEIFRLMYPTYARVCRENRIFKNNLILNDPVLSRFSEERMVLEKRLEDAQVKLSLCLSHLTQIASNRDQATKPHELAQKALNTVNQR